MKERGVALLEISAGCNAECVFCLRNDARRERSPMPERADLSALAVFLRLARRLGLSRLIVGGDEPTVLGPGPLESMLGLAQSAGFFDIALFSNAILLGQEGFLKRLIAAGVTSFHLPLYGPEAGLHDAVTRRKGSFRALCRALKTLSRLRDRAKAELHTIVLRQNEARLDEMRALAAGWGVSLDVQALCLRDDPVGYEALLPLGGHRPIKSPKSAKPPLPSRTDRGGPQLCYNVLLGRLNFGSGSPEIARLILDLLRDAGLPARFLGRAVRHYERKPSFSDPGRFLRLLDVIAARRFADFDLDLLVPADAGEALALGLRTLRQGRRLEGQRALREALLFKEGDEKSLWAKEKARSLLERLERGGSEVREEACRG